MVSIWMPDAPPATPNAQDDEFADASGGLPSGWTEFDPGAIQTVNESAAGCELSTATHAGSQVTGIYKSIPSGDFSIMIKVALSGLGVTNSIRAMICLWEDPSNTAKALRTLGITQNATQGQIDVIQWNNYTTLTSTLASLAMSVDEGPTVLYLRIRRTGTAYAFDVSSDGNGFEQVHTIAALGITPTAMGLAMDNTASGANVKTTTSFFRYKASDVGIFGALEGDRIAVTPA